MSRKIPLIEAIREAFAEEMQLDEKVFLVGQDLRGGIYPHTMGLVDQFGEDRVVDTPISESGMYGTAMGAAQALIWIAVQEGREAEGRAWAALTSQVMGIGKGTGVAGEG